MTNYKVFGEHVALPLRPSQLSDIHTGKVFLVTGGGGGLGKGLIQTLVEQGASVVASDRDISTIAFPDTERDNCLALSMDVADPSSVEAGVQAAIAWKGRIDGVVNAAGIAIHRPPLDTDIETWRRQFEINVFGAYAVTRHIAKAMISAGIKGAVVMVASEAGKIGHPETLMAYSASKAALINMTRMLSASLAPYDINVNCVCPGAIATPMLEEVATVYSEANGVDPKVIFNSMISSQLCRHSTPEEVARIISFLLSNDSMLIRGQSINVDGGDTPY